jgi:ArsR family transcriptional regulator, arsenate/arsenite/antimonite-responsive transcriptional repressor
VDYAYNAKILKALSDEKRLKIVGMLSHGPMCACRILKQFDFTQPALSQHMKILMSCGLVSGEREGNWMHYSLVREKYDEMIRFIQLLKGDSKE